MNNQNFLSINFHLLEACNMRCRFCFAKYGNAKKISIEHAIPIIQQIAEAGFSKISFAGGEPLLHPQLPQLITYAKAQGLTTMLITNGAFLTTDFLNKVAYSLDWIGLSIDSISHHTNLISGRAVQGIHPISNDAYYSLAKEIKNRGIALKINTVVHAQNCNERMCDFINMVQPQRWKIMQVIFNTNANEQARRYFSISADAFSDYVIENRFVNSKIKIVAESELLLRGSYLMIDPQGRLYDSCSGKHSFSSPVLEIGLTKALELIEFDLSKFDKRGGTYNWHSKL